MPSQTPRQRKLTPNPTFSRPSPVLISISHSPSPSRLPGDSARSVAKLLHTRYLDRWRISSAHRATFHSGVPRFLQLLQPTVTSSQWSFAVCLLSDSLPFLSRCLSRAATVKPSLRSGAMDPEEFERLAVVEACPPLLLKLSPDAPESRGVTRRLVEFLRCTSDPTAPELC